jgi:hypothetical protein
MRGPDVSFGDAAMAVFFLDSWMIRVFLKGTRTGFSAPPRGGATHATREEHSCG